MEYRIVYDNYVIQIMKQVRTWNMLHILFLVPVELSIFMNTSLIYLLDLFLTTRSTSLWLRCTLGKPLARIVVDFPKGFSHLTIYRNGSFTWILPKVPNSTFILVHFPVRISKKWDICYLVQYSRFYNFIVCSFWCK